MQHVLEELRRRVQDDGEGGDEVEQQHYLDDHPHDARGDGEDNVGLGVAAVRVVGDGRHGEVDDEQNCVSWKRVLAYLGKSKAVFASTY